MSPQPPFSIVIAAKNEAQTIAAVLRDLQVMSDDIIVVDGHSADETPAIARSYGARVLQDSGLGKGDAVRVGIRAARHPALVFIDADGSHDPNDIPKLLAPIVAGDADLVIGSRMLGGSDELFGSLPEVIRALGSMIISLSINYRYGVQMTDYQNGFRAIRTDVARTLNLTSNITTIEQEMAMKCLRHGYRVAECAAHEYRRKGGVSKISVMRWAPIYIWNLVCGIMVPRVQARPATAAEPGRTSAWEPQKEAKRG